MTAQERLLAFARETAYPYMMNLPFYTQYADDISVLLVGSVATGLCRETSDVDICLLCGETSYEDISKGTGWGTGQPTEVVIDGTQIHYYAVSFQKLKKRILGYEDAAFYLYGNAVLFNDNSGFYSKIMELIDDDNIKAIRKEKALDMLVRRNRALKQILKYEKDPILRITVGLELIGHLLKMIALSDGVPFDKRKRFYTTALVGDLGKQLKPRIGIMISSLGKIGNWEKSDISAQFMKALDKCIGFIPI